MPSTCPAGHSSTADDYCDVCGVPIPAGAQGVDAAAPSTATSAPAAPEGLSCPNCAVANLPEALFCEACGYDFTTGTMPRSAGGDAGAGGDAANEAADATAQQAPVGSGVEWVAEVWIDPDWYEAQESPDALPSPGLPDVVPLVATSVLVGRTSRSRNITPDIDCESDTGISRRQAQLTTDGSRWWVEDLESANGTFVAPASGPLPEDPIPVGRKTELDSDDRIYLGAWTRIVIRRATDDEKVTVP